MASVSLATLPLTEAVAATPHAPVIMPHLVGLNRAQVFAVMHRHGLYFVTEGPGAATETWSRVAEQRPAAGAKIAWHGEATLLVTTAALSGPRPVPGVAGLSRAEVFRRMHDSALYFVTRGPGSENGTWTTALSVSPAPGTNVAWHAEVVVYVTDVTPTKPTPTPATPATHATASGTVTDGPDGIINGAGYKIGTATWYDYIPGQCATWYLPKGTQLTVTDLATGHSISCTITDREPEADTAYGRVIDLNQTQFAELAPLSTGVIRVKVSW